MITKRLARLGIILAAFVAALLLLAPFVAFAAPGDLDTTFGGGDGIVTTPVGSGQDTAGAQIAIQADGKLVQVGTTFTGPANNDMVVVRYNADGSLDLTFDGDGIVVLDWGGNDFGETVALQDDGKILVVGLSNIGGNFDFAVARLNSDGTLDTTFDGDGLVTTPVGTLHDRAYAVALQDDGKIVVGGYARPGGTVDNDFALVRYNSDGSLDSTFDTDGIVTTSIGSTQDQVYQLAIQSDNKIVALGYANVGGSYNFVLARYNADGSLDNTFDSGGIVLTDIDGQNDFAYGLALQDDGKIVSVGYVDPSGTNNNYIALTRHDSDGNLDASFGTGGVVTTTVGPYEETAGPVVIDESGKLVVAGRVNAGTFFDIGLFRYNADGTLDSSFGVGGVVTTSIGASHDMAQSVNLQADGRIVVGANHNNGSNNDFAVLRYEAEPPETDLTISKSAGPDPVVAGETLTYTITVTNAGVFEATGVVVTDTLPAGVSNPVTTGCAEDPGGAPNCTLGTIAAGSSATYTLAVTVDSDVTGNLTNEVEVGADTTLINTGDDTDSVTTTVTAASDLTISKSASPDPVQAGETLTYTITVTNTGPSDAQGVTVVDALPAGVSDPVSTGCAEDPGGALNCTLGTIAAGASATYTLAVTVDDTTSGDLTNEATVSATSPLINTGDDTASVTTTVTPYPATDLAITMSGSSGPVMAGTGMTYVVTVTNNGPSEAVDVTVVSTLPAGVTDMATVGCDEDPGGMPTCNLGTLAAGSSVSFTAHMESGRHTPGPLTTSVEVSAATPLMNTGDDSAEMTTDVMFVYIFAHFRVDAPAQP